MVRHPGITHTLSGLYLDNGVHLTDIHAGTDFFLNIFKRAIEWLLQSGLYLGSVGY